MQIVLLDTTLAGVVLAVGAPVLVLLYYLEGLLIGKLLHPSILLLVYLIVTDPGILVLFAVPGACAIAATLGQWHLYRGFNEELQGESWFVRSVPYLDRVPGIVKRRIGRKRMAFIHRQFDRFGGTAICFSNATPGLRGLMTIIAGLSNYSSWRFIVLSAIGNIVYMLLIIAVVTGLLEVIRFIPVDRLLADIG